MHDHFSAIGFWLPKGTEPLVLAGEAVRQGEKRRGGVPGITILTHAWEVGAGLGIWAVTHEERRDILTAYPVCHPDRLQPFDLAEMEWDGAEAVTHGHLDKLPLAFHVSNYCVDSLWELAPGPCEVGVVGLAYGARLTAPGDPGLHALCPAGPEGRRFTQEACDFAFRGRVEAAQRLRNPITGVRLWRLTLGGTQPAPWHLTLIVPHAWLEGLPGGALGRLWGRPRPGWELSGLCWLQGELRPTNAQPSAAGAARSE